MTRLNKKVVRVITRAVVLVVVVMLVGQCSVSSSSAAESTPGTVTVTKLSLNKKGQPRVKVTTGAESVELAFGLPYSDFNSDDLVPQGANTTQVYKLPVVKKGTRATWIVSSYVAGGPTELSYDTFMWKRWDKSVARFGVTTSGETDVNAEVHPLEGGKLKVGALRARVVSSDGTKAWLNLTEAYCHDGPCVYNLAVGAGLTIKKVVGQTLYGVVRNVAVTPAGAAG